MTININCDCTDPIGTAYSTLSVLRRRMMVRLGFAIQADTPPPGMTDLIDDFLQSAQTLLWEKHKELRGERWFTWNVAEGDRLFDLDGNTEYPACDKLLDPLKITWVGIEDATGTEDGTWLPLTKGINPMDYTIGAQTGTPAMYEIRQCIEIFPAADRAMRLRIKGHFAQLPFTEDTDKTSIDSELVFLWALSNAKAHYNKPDATNIRSEANTRLGDLKAGRHLTARYIPGTVETPPAVKPVFIPLVTP
jgi:hypothetical protein